MFIRVGGGSQAQDHGQAIYAKIRYSVSSTFATGCSMKTEDESKINRFYKQKFQIIFFVHDNTDVKPKPLKQ